MNATQIDFSLASNITEATKWVYDPDKEITPGAALQHCLLEQRTNELATVTAYCTNKVWMQRHCSGNGIIGTKYLFDGEDLITRVSRQEIWKKNSLRITQNKTNSMKLECIQGTDANDRPISVGNINIGTYGGDLSDFQVPSAEDYKLVCTCRAGFEFKSVSKTCSTFSALRGDTANRLVWFVVTTDGIRVNVTERASNRGIGLLSYLVDAEADKPVRFGVYGRFLTKISDLVEESPIFTIKFDKDKDPTRVRFTGDKGWVDLPLVEGYFCRALSEGSVGIFLGENYELERKCTKTFDIDELINGLSIQTPKKGANRNDIVLEMEGQNLKVSKRSDIRCSEVSYITCSTLNADPWEAVVADHTYLTDALEALDSYLTKEKEKAEAFTFESEDEEELLEEDEARQSPNGGSKHVSLTLAYNKKYDMRTIFIEPAIEGQYSYCRAAVIVNTKEKTNDFNETD